MKINLHIIQASLLACCLSWLSCSSDADLPAVAERSISFTQAAFFLPAQDKTSVTIALTKAAESDLTVPFSLTGTAVEGEDYSVAEHAFHIARGETSASVEINSLGSVSKGRQLMMTLDDAPQGYAFGLYRTTRVPIAARPVLTATFDATEYELKTEVEVSMTLYQGSRKYTSSLQAVEVPVEVAPASTALLGKHFEFVNGKSVLTTAKSSSVAKAKIRLLKREAGHDKIVLRLADSRYFNAGAQNRATITLAGPTDLKLLAGTWHCKGLSNEAAIRAAANLIKDEEDAANLPKNIGQGDQIVLTTTANGALALDISKLKGDLSRYLRSATLTYSGEGVDKLWETDYNNPAVDNVLTLKASKVNLFFSATETKERGALIDFRLLDKGKTLEMRVYQYEPKDFLTRVYEARKVDVYSSGDLMKRGFTLIYRFTK